MLKYKIKSVCPKCGHSKYRFVLWSELPKQIFYRKCKHCDLKWQITASRMKRSEKICIDKLEWEEI